MKIKKTIRTVILIFIILFLGITVIKLNTILANASSNKMSYEDFKKYMENNVNRNDSPEIPSDIYSDKDLELMAYLIEAETTGQNFESKCNVANVIWNRLESDSTDFKYMDTIKKVIYQKSQFSPVTDGKLWENKPTQETLDAIDYSFIIKDTTNGATYFHSGKSNWHKNNLEYIFTDDVGHKFYK